MVYWEQIIRKFVLYGPKIFGAFIILIVGWLIVLIVSSLIGKALHRTGLDEKIAGKVMGERKGQDMQSYRWISKIIYYVLMFFVLEAFFQTLGLTLVTQPLNELLSIVFSYLPQALRGSGAGAHGLDRRHCAEKSDPACPASGKGG